MARPSVPWQLAQVAASARWRRASGEGAAWAVAAASRPSRASAVFMGGGLLVTGPAPSGGLCHQLIVNAAVVEMDLLGLAPAAEDLAHGEGADFGEGRAGLCQRLGRARPQGVPHRQPLAFLGPQP